MTESHQEIKHENNPLCRANWKIGGFNITNSYLNSILASLLLVMFFVLATKKISKVPRGIQNIFELILEGALNFSDSITGDRKKSEKYLPLVLALFLFILINNWLGLIPGVGTVGQIQKSGAELIFVPFFRGATADVNTTLALALVAVVASHVFGILAVGFWKYFNKFINFHALAAIPSKFATDKSIVLVNPIKFFVGLIEIIGEFAKIASLTFRLFGNIFAGEVLLVSMMALFAFVLPLPFIFLEILVGIIQALVFSILTLVFIGMSSAEEH